MLSIIIPTLNEAHFLPGLLTDIKSQDLPEHEIIVSDGCSEDDTLQIAEQYNCRTVTSQNRNPAHQRNAGAKAALGDQYLFLDADTRIPDGFFPTVLDEFTSRKLDVAGFYFKLN
ncbi:MAG TPA: glycosyltransferase [bacterium]|nr:glycosyltransferase [bacterium]